MKLYNVISQKMHIRVFILLIVFSINKFSGAQNTLVIPQPVSMAVHKGNFFISPTTVLIAKDPEDLKAAKFLNDYLIKIYGISLPVSNKALKGFIKLTTRKFIKAPGKDAYSLKVNKNGVLIEGDTYAGTFYGIQSLIQLLPVNGIHQGNKKTRSLLVPFVTMNDYPRFDYRGMHLDVARHFFPIPFIKKYIDYLALHKMNFFHWHLTDDQGWRIEIKKYPLLTQVGAYRNGTIIGRYPGIGNDNLKYGGFYTQDEIKDVVAYAAKRFITI